MANYKNFKSLLPVDLSFVKAKSVAFLEVDDQGAPLLHEARKRLLDGGLIEVKIENKKEIASAPKQQVSAPDEEKGVK
jgi:hypothetical protein